MPLKGFLMLLLRQTFNEFSIFLSSALQCRWAQSRNRCCVLQERRLNTISLLDYRLWLPFTISLDAKFYKCFTVVHNHQFGKFLQKYWFFLVRWQWSKELTGTPWPKVLIVIFQSSVIWGTCSKICGISSKVLCFVCWWNFRDAGCVKPLLQTRHLIHTNLEE